MQTLLMLKAMIIDTWVNHVPLAGEKTLSYTLHRLGFNYYQPVGYLFLSNHYPKDCFDEIQKLLNAMFSAISLKLYDEIFFNEIEAKIICVMGIDIVETMKMPVFKIHHPYELLKNPTLKRDAWEDLKSISAIIHCC